MEHGADYTGDYIFNVDYNHIYNYGGDILSDFGAVYITSKFNCDGASEDELEVEALSRITEDTRWKINLFRWLSNSWNILIFKENSNNQEVLKKVELVKSTKCL